MIAPKFFYDSLLAQGVGFFSGVPDSLLKDFCAYITDYTQSPNHIIAANEGAAVGLAAGYHIATGKYPVVYLQNSGFGNIINPLLSLVDPEVYKIPIVFVMGWRGEPGTTDEPQHMKQGKVTESMLRSIDTKYVILEGSEEIITKQMDECFNYMKNNGAPFVFIIKKGTFSEYKLIKETMTNFELGREDALKIVLSSFKENDIIVSTTGMLSRELYEYREFMGQTHDNDFLTVGSMGHSSQIALGIALQKKDKKIYCLDGDGSIIMHMGSLSIIGDKSPHNFKHIVFNNGAHDSVGGQSTVGFSTDLCKIACACNYKQVFAAATKIDIERNIKEFILCEGPAFFEIKINKGYRENLGRPTTNPIQNKDSFMRSLKT